MTSPSYTESNVISHEHHAVLMDTIKSSNTVSADSPFRHINMSDDIECIKDIMLTSLQTLSDSSLSQLVSSIQSSSSMDNLLALFPNWQDVITHSTKALEIEYWVDQITNQFFPQ